VINGGSYNAGGQAVGKVDEGTSGYRIDLSGWRPGLYFLRMQDDKACWIFRTN